MDDMAVKKKTPLEDLTEAFLGTPSEFQNPLHVGKHAPKDVKRVPGLPKPKVKSRSKGKKARKFKMAM